MVIGCMHSSALTITLAALTAVAANASQAPQKPFPIWNQVEFAPDSALIQGGFGSLDRLAKALGRNSGYSVNILAIPDAVSAQAGRTGLHIARAKALQTYLVDHGAPAALVRTSVAARAVAPGNTAGVEISLTTPDRRELPFQVALRAAASQASSQTVRQRVVTEVRVCPDPGPNGKDAASKEVLAALLAIQKDLQVLKDRNETLQKTVERLENRTVVPVGAAVQTSGNIAFDQVGNLIVNAYGSLTATQGTSSTMVVNNECGSRDTCPGPAPGLGPGPSTIVRNSSFSVDNSTLSVGQSKVEIRNSSIVLPENNGSTIVARGSSVEVRDSKLDVQNSTINVSGVDTTSGRTYGGSAPRKFSMLAFNAGTTNTGDLTINSRGRYFSPFGENNHAAVQAQAEYLRYNDRQEGQFDIGLVNRWTNVQAGLFSSFKYADFREFGNGGSLGQAAVTIDYLLPRGRVGLFGTLPFKSTATINRAQLGTASTIETYLRVVNQYGFSGQFGLWGKTYVEGNIAYLKTHDNDNRPGGLIRFVQPLVHTPIAFTVETGWNETLVGAQRSGRVAFGVAMGGGGVSEGARGFTAATPVDIPRIRYEMLTRRIGNSPPIADAGHDQIGIKSGTVTLNGSASTDPDGDPITYQWVQTGGPWVAISGANAAIATFNAAENQSYSFRLTVRDPGGLSSSARTAVTTTQTCTVAIYRFTTTPDVVNAGDSVILQWKTNGESVTIEPSPGDTGPLPPQGSVTVKPASDTTYTLVAHAGACTDRLQTVVRVASLQPAIIRFEASPQRIAVGGVSNLSWTTQGATKVTITPGLGDVALNGSATVSPSASTTYTLTASRDGRDVSASLQVAIAAPGEARIVRFGGTPGEIREGESASLCWDVRNAKTASLSPGTFPDLKLPDGCVTVAPTATQKYTLTVTGDAGTPATAEVVIAVRPLVRILTFTVNPQQVTADQPRTTLSWTSANATRVVITGNGAPSGSLPPNGSVAVTIAADTVFTLIAYGADSEVSADALVRFAAPTCAPPVANAGPDQTVTVNYASLNGRASVSPNGFPLRYRWETLGGISAEISEPNSATATGILNGGYGEYVFRLVVTTDCGSSSALTRVKYIDP